MRDSRAARPDRLFLRRQYLVHHLPGRHVAPEAHGGRRAEDAADGTPHLAGDADGGPRFVGQEHGLDPPPIGLL